MDMLFKMRFLHILSAILVIAISASAQVEVIELTFDLPAMDSETDQLYKNVVRIQGTGGSCQSGLFLMTHYGDREDLFQRENRSMIENPLIDRTWRYCTSFSVSSDDAVLMGRNWDNENVGSIIVSYYNPTNGYSSIAFSRAIDLGFPLHVDLSEIASSYPGDKLLLAPFCAYDGMNEHGLAVSVAGSKSESVEPIEGRESIFVPFLIRKILDQTKSVEEAVRLVEEFVPFDLNVNSLNSHLFVVDSSGQSVVLEYAQNQWRMIYGEKPWQVMSTKPIYNVSDSTLRNKCWRYRTVSEKLGNNVENTSWENCIGILKDVSQVGTTWSAVYSLTTGEMYLSVYQQWGTVYHLKLP